MATHPPPAASRGVTQAWEGPNIARRAAAWLRLPAAPRRIEHIAAAADGEGHGGPA